MNSKTKGKTAEISQDEMTILKVDYDAFICYKTEEALYGVSAESAKEAIEKMIIKKDETTVRLCVGAYNQIADTFRSTIQRDYKRILETYGIFLRNEEIVYVALNMCGAIILRAAKESDVSKMSFKKNGNATKGGIFPESESGKIKRDMWENKFSGVDPATLDFEDNESAFLYACVEGIKLGSQRFRALKAGPPA